MPIKLCFIIARLMPGFDLRMKTCYMVATALGYTLQIWDFTVHGYKLRKLMKFDEKQQVSYKKSHPSSSAKLV